jgi:two-component system CheB/CheR fusion protein
MSGRTVFLVEPEELIRRSVGTVLSEHGIGFKAFSSVADVPEEDETEQCGCILLSFDAGGLGTLEHLSGRTRRVPVVVLAQPCGVPTAVAAMKRGAADYLEHPVADRVLLQSVREALADGSRSPEPRSPGSRRLFHKLTLRQREVLQLVLAGYRSREIARQLGISKKTVDLHRASIMRRTGMRSMFEVVSLVLASRDDAPHAVAEKLIQDQDAPGEEVSQRK